MTPTSSPPTAGNTMPRSPGSPPGTVWRWTACSCRSCGCARRRDWSISTRSRSTVRWSAATRRWIQSCPGRSWTVLSPSARRRSPRCWRRRSCVRSAVRQRSDTGPGRPAREQRPGPGPAVRPGAALAGGERGEDRRCAADGRPGRAGAGRGRRRAAGAFGCARPPECHRPRSQAERRDRPARAGRTTRRATRTRRPPWYENTGNRGEHQNNSTLACADHDFPRVRPRRAPPPKRRKLTLSSRNRLPREASVVKSHHFRCPRRDSGILVLQLIVH